MPQSSPRYALGTGKMLHGVQIHISDYHAVESARVLGALIAELAELAPDRNLFADYRREDGSFPKVELREHNPGLELDLDDALVRLIGPHWASQSDTE